MFYSIYDSIAIYFLVGDSIHIAWPSSSLSFMVHAFVSPVPSQLSFFVLHTSDKVCAGVAMICYLLHSSTTAESLVDGFSWGCGPFNTHVISNLQRVVQVPISCLTHR